MIFAQMLEIVALSDLASLLCARKFLFAPQGSVPQIALFSFIIIIILLLLFLVPRSAVGTYGLAYVRSSVRPSGRDLKIRS